MSLFRWLGVALLTLASAGATQAQTASFSVLGLTTLFTQEAPAEASVLPWIPVQGTDFFRLPLNHPYWSGGEEAEELPPPRRCDPRCCESEALSMLLKECLKAWKEEWQQGNYYEADAMAALACWLDPTNVDAQHAQILAHILQDLSPRLAACKACPISACGTTCPVNDPVCLGIVLADCAVGGVVGQVIDMACGKTKQSTCCTDCCAVKTSATTCACAAKTCACAAKAECCCAKACACAKACPCVAKTCGCGSANCACGAKPAACPCAQKAVKNEAKCGCGKECSCCKCGTTEKKVRSVRKAASKTIVVRELIPGDMPRVAWSERALPPPPLPPGVPGSVIAVSPPMIYPCPMPPAPPGMACPVYSGPFLPPTPMQAAQDLEYVRNAAMAKARLTQATQVSAQRAGKQLVHLVTPHLEAHCDRLTCGSDPDHIILEGDVTVTSNRNGQVLRIQGQRVHVYLSEGRFTVESASSPTRPQPLPTRPAVPAQPATYMAPATSFMVPLTPLDRVPPAPRALPPSPFGPLKPYGN